MSEQDPKNRIDEELTSYLDGELGLDQTRRVEERLASDDGYRGRLQDLQKTWDMLDHLPRPESNENFTRSTIEMAVQTGAPVSRSSLNFGWLFPALLLIAIPVSGFVAGKFATDHFQEAPRRQLLADLALLENLQYFRYAESIEFVDALSDVFVDEQTPDMETPVSILDESPEMAGERLDSYDLEQLNEIRKSRNTFQQLPEADQQRIRKLQAELAVHEERSRLIAVMQRYNSWLFDGLSARQRREVLDLPADQRIERIRELRLHPELLDGVALDSRDLDEVYKWSRETIQAEKELINVHAESREFLEKLTRYMEVNPDNRIQMKLLDDLGLLDQVDPEFVFEIVSRNVQLLRVTLSHEADRILDDAWDPEKQKELVIRWVVTATAAREDVTRDELMEYLKTLPEATVERLDRLSPDELLEELQRMFRREKLRRGFYHVPENSSGSLDDTGAGSEALIRRVQMRSATGLQPVQSENG
ncbi:MAG: hypothetical protein AAF456_19840 [Planctomycetota bacterium]